MQVKGAKLDKRHANTPGELLTPLLKSDLVRAFIVNCQP